MDQVILQPAGSKNAEIHYSKTIENLVSFEVLNKYLNEKDMATILSLYPDKKAMVWGVTSGLKDVNFRKWKKISRGDIAFFCKNGKIISTATVTHKIHNRDLAQKLWGKDENSKSTWEYIYFLDELMTQSIPYSRINSAAGYNTEFIVRGFSVLDEEKSSKILSLLDLGSENIFPEISEKEYINATTLLDKKNLDHERRSLARVEQGFLRNALFGKLKMGKCCICGSSYPIELLVAAHIKKRSECTDTEKRDWRNIVAPMCKLGCDELYERGYISIHNGKIIVLKQQPPSSSLSNILKSLEGKDCLKWDQNSARYFLWHSEYHRKHI